MGMKSFVKNAVVKGFNVRKWVDYDNVKDSTQSVVGMVKDVYSAPESSRKETFDQAVKRLGLTEADIQQRMRTARYVSIGCAVSIVPMLVYATFLILNGTIMAGIVSVTLTMLLGAYAFRESFNYFQMQQRRLGCTVKEWFNNLF